MKREYIAFISYRHLELDKAVAQQLHRLLEHYRIPKELRRVENQSRLGIVFRDRDELPLSSNLTQDIYTALDHSEYLIVICTPDTPKSEWVRSEIKYFLKNHTRDRVITVLAAGTPEESIPEEITTIYDEDETTVLQNIEPLCAYLVAPEKQKVIHNLKKEFLRLVAAILGCPYDALRQREKHYQQRRLLLLASAIILIASGFIIMLAMKNRQIQEQLQETKWNESHALTLLSEAKLSSGDRIGAIKNAVSALPSDEDKRPYYAQAKTALINALYVYDEPKYQYLSQISAPGFMSKLGVSPDGKYAIIHTDGEAECYDIQHGTLLWSFVPDEIYLADSFHFLSEKNAVLYVSCAEKVRLLSLDRGEVIFTYEFEDPFTFVEISPDKEQFVVRLYGEDGIYTCFCSLRDGSMIRTAIPGTTGEIARCDGTYSVDGSVFAALYAADFGNGQEVCMELYDTVDGRSKSIATIQSCEGELKPDSPMILSMNDGTYVIAFNHPYNRNFMHVSSDGRILASTYASSETRAHWTANGDMKIIDNRILWIYKNLVVCLDPQTMDIIGEDTLDETLGFQMLASAGSMLYKDDNAIYEYKLTDAGKPKLVEKILIGNDCTIACAENTTSVFAAVSTNLLDIQFYQKTGGDIWKASNCLPIKLSGNYIYLPKFCSAVPSADGESILFRDADGEGAYPQSVYQITEGKVTTLSESNLGVKAVFTSDGSGILEGIEYYNIATGEKRTLVGAEDLSESAIIKTVRASELMPEEPVLMVAYDKGKLYYWKDGAECVSVDIPGQQSTGVDVELYCGANGLILLYYSDSHTALVYNTVSEKFHTLEEADIQNAIIGRRHPVMAMIDSTDKCSLYDFSETEPVLKDVYPDFDFVYAMFLRDDSKLLGFDANHTASVLDTESGEILMVFHFLLNEYVYVSPIDLIGIQEDARGEYLYIWNRIGDSDGVMIDMSTWTMVHSMPKMVGYLRASDTMLFLGNDDTEVYAQKVYRLEELLQLAEELIK